MWTGRGGRGAGAAGPLAGSAGREGTKIAAQHRAPRNQLYARCNHPPDTLECRLLHKREGVNRYVRHPQDGCAQPPPCLLGSYFLLPCPCLCLCLSFCAVCRMPCVYLCV
jgi:hypothetical protein